MKHKTLVLSHRLIIADFIEAIDRATSLDAMFNALELAAYRMGFEGIAYTYAPALIVDSLGSNTPVFKVSESYSPQFIQHYSEELFAESDFTIKRILSGDLTPMNWWKEVSDKTITKQETRVLQVARTDYHLTNGLSVPTYAQSGSIAGVSVISSDQSYMFEKLCADSVDSLQKISRIFSNRVIGDGRCRNFFLASFLNGLSPTQKSILKGLAKGEHLKQISSRLNISYKYSFNVVDQLKEKFGQVNREQLMYIAGVLQIEEML